jgi:RNA polymerase sigma-70 factor (ECF subfamily)
VARSNVEFAWFFREEFPRVVRAVFLVLNDRQRAEDVAQEAFIQLLSHWKKVSRYDRPEAWVRRVAIRLAVRALRRERRRSVVERALDVPTPAVPQDIDVLQAVRQLPGAQRAVIVLFYFEDRPVAEIAEILGCAQATAKVHLHRARRRLGKMLGEEESLDVS